MNETIKSQFFKLIDLLRLTVIIFLYAMEKTKMRHFFRIFVIYASVSTLLFGCTEKPETNSDLGEIINMFEAEDIPTLDPNDASDPISLNSIANVMEGLVMQSPTPGEVIPGVASVYTFDESSLTWTFKLNPESVWVNSQGELQRAVTASDFVFSWDRLSSDEPFQYSFMLSDVAKIVSYEALDDQTLTVTLSENVPYFLSIMAFGTLYPIPYETFEANEDGFGATAESMWYNGAYYMSEWTHGSRFIWTRNEHYWEADVVRTPAVTWRIIESYEPATGVELYDAGEIDKVPLVGEFAVERKNDADAIVIADTAVYYLMFNIANGGIVGDSPILDSTYGNPLFDNLKIRQAMALQIDKSYITDVILKDGSSPAFGFIPSNYLSYEGISIESMRNDGYMLTNKDEARRLFEEGMSELGYTFGDNQIEIEIINYETSTHALIIEYIRQELNTLFADYGITISIRPLPLAEKLSIYQAGEFDLTLSRWLPDYDWPTTYLDKWISDNAYNLAGYANNEYDALVLPSNKTDVQAFEDLQSAEAIVINDAAIIPLYQAANTYLQNPAVHNIYTFLSGYDSSFKWAYKETNN